MKTKYKVGDQIVITDKSRFYSSYKNWAQQNGLTKFVNKVVVGNGYTGKVVAVNKHSYGSEIYLYGILCHGQHYVVGECAIELVNTKDIGEDLINKKFSRGGACVYTFYRFDEKNNTIHFTWQNNSNTQFCTVEYARKKIHNGNWTLKPEEKTALDNHESHITVGTRIHSKIEKTFIAQYLYKHLSNNKWNFQDIAELHFKTVKEHLINNSDYSDYEVMEIKKSIQDISLKAEQTQKTNELIKMNGISNCQSYNPQTETYSTKQKENTMENATNNTLPPKTHQTIAVQVPVSAYAETTVITMYGHEVDTKNESELFSLLARIEDEQAVLKNINKTAKSTRVTTKIAALGSARNKVVAMIDALPEE
jgi:hypothetical protein